MVRQSNWGRFTSLSVNESACKSFWVAWTRKGRKQRVAASFSASVEKAACLWLHIPLCVLLPPATAVNAVRVGRREGVGCQDGLWQYWWFVVTDWCVEVIGYPGEGTRAAVAFLAQFTCVPSNKCDKEIHCQTGNVLDVLGTWKKREVKLRF